MFNVSFCRVEGGLILEMAEHVNCFHLFKILRFVGKGTLLLNDSICQRSPYFQRTGL